MVSSLTRLGNAGVTSLEWMIGMAVDALQRNQIRSLPIAVTLRAGFDIGHEQIRTRRRLVGLVTIKARFIAAQVFHGLVRKMVKAFGGKIIDCQHYRVNLVT